jgi:hypothetical protein
MYGSALDLEPAAGKNAVNNPIYFALPGIILLTVKFNI